ncbi:MAG: 2TM domain-containing protein [Solirubrobacteraceae bacterium]
MNNTTDRESATERALARRDAIALTCTGPLVTAILLVVWAMTGAGYFWPVWPMLGMSIALVVALWRAFGPPPHAGPADPRARPR